MDFTITLIFCLIMSIILVVSFFSRKQVTSDETSIYSKLLIINMIGIIIETSFIFFNKFDIDLEFKRIVMNAYFIYLLGYMSYIGVYIFKICFSEKSNDFHRIIRYIILVTFLIFSVVVCFLPIKMYDGYSVGAAANAVYIYTAIFFALCGIAFFMNIRTVNYRKMLPMFMLAIISFILSIVQKIYPQFVIMTEVHFIVLFVMYHTIENPDEKIARLQMQAKIEAEKINSIKNELLASMSHELRTPLNTINGLSEDIDAYKEKLPDDIRNNSDDIIDASNSLLELINNVLDISKLDIGKLEIINSYYNPKKEIENIVNSARKMIIDKQIELIVNVSNNMPRVLYGDCSRIKQIINNLIRCSINNTTHGNIALDILWLDDEKSLSFRLSDTGNGLKKEEIDNILNKEINSITSIKGIELNLLISKSIVELMNGEFGIYNNHGNGTTYYVVIPQVIGGIIDLVREHELENQLPDDLSLFRGKKILIVDDDVLNIKVLKKTLNKYNFITEECYNGKDCIDKINNGNTYDLILLDNLMPIMDGEETIKLLKSKPEFNTKVFILTADAINGAREKYIKMGFDDYLSKPFRRDSIIRKMYNVFYDDNDSMIEIGNVESVNKNDIN